MPTSEWKIRANIANAAKSTGPKTDEGKARARANSFKTGFSGEGDVVPDTEAQAIEKRMNAWRGQYVIDSPTKEWAFEQLVVFSLRVRSCQEHQRALEDHEQQRAASVWRIDRQFEAALLGDRLPRKPEIVARELLKSKHGCEWMMEEWRVLGLALDSGPWTDEELQRALDLCGIAHHARNGMFVEDPSALAESEYMTLQSLVNGCLGVLDEGERLDAMAGASGKPSKEMARLRRYEAACQKRCDRFLAMLAAAPVEVPAAPEPVEEAPPPPPEPQPDAYAAHMAKAKAFAEYNKAWEAAPASERPNLIPNLPGLPLPARFRDAVPAPTQPAAQPMNRKQRKAMERRARSAK